MSNCDESSLDRQAQLYALLHRGNPGDIEYYERCCSGAQTVLELGVGYGRVGLRLAAKGASVTGIDNHAGLLAMARASAELLGVTDRFEARAGDMRDFAFERRFDRILIPYSGLYCLLEDSDLVACLGCCRANLAAGGLLAFDVYESDGFHAACDPVDMGESEREPVVEISYGSQLLMVYESSSWDKPRQRLDVHYHYYDESGTLVHTATIRQRYWLVAQLLDQLTAHGFRQTRVAGGFRGEPVTPLADAVVFEAQ
jgi:SAM-dependent methyltransferase